MSDECILLCMIEKYLGTVEKFTTVCNIHFIAELHAKRHDKVFELWLLPPTHGYETKCRT